MRVGFSVLFCCSWALVSAWNPCAKYKLNRALNKLAVESSPTVVHTVQAKNTRSRMLRSVRMGGYVEKVNSEQFEREVQEMSNPDLKLPFIF